MSTIRHRVGIDAPLATVYEALATTTGLAGWWTRHVEGDPEVGGKLSFWFGSPDPSAVFEVLEVDPRGRVVWRCVEGPAEWVDTTVTFDLVHDAGETVVRFEHADWREPVEFMSHCSTKWGYFLLGLKAGLEGGTATPYPGEVQISSWG
jgi:uncharacterized protein YndB with AHSA1/START domain